MSFAVKLKETAGRKERQGKIKECVIKSPSNSFALLASLAVKLKETTLLKLLKIWYNRVKEACYVYNDYDK
ncbi:hypothetical protein JO40_13080 [Treponema putidum]|nr:hypothetical protein JO40_13080 [Treponema putidum]